MDSPTATQPFLLLFRNTSPETFEPLSPDERDQLVSRWNAWYEELVAEGKATEGQPLLATTKTIIGGGGQRIVDGPYPESKEAVGGFVKLQVGSWEEATDIARRHPALEYGMRIEVRQCTEHCHLGVTAHRQARSASAR